MNKIKLVFATNNAHKLEEVSQMLGDRYEILGLQQIGCNEDIPETADTLEGNALIKARYVKEKYGFDCFADDTGLEVEALGNEPGVYSARYAGIDKDSEANMNKVLAKLEGQANRNARFRTVIAYVTDAGETLFDGIVEGEILTEKRGGKGFGYDPIFMPKGFDVTFAEMDAASKNEISHRGRATRLFIASFGK